MIPTEPIGSIPRPPELMAAVEATGDPTHPGLDALFEAAVKDTIERFEATGSPVITDGEQRKYHNFWTYSVHGLANTAPNGFQIPFANGHTRYMPRLTAGPFRYRVYADSYLEAGKFYIALAGEPDREHVLKTIRANMRPDKRIFVGVCNPIDPRIETAIEVRDRVLEAARYIPVEQLGTTDDCGYSPFSDDTSTSRDTAFAKIAARVQGTELARQAVMDW